MVSYTEDVKHMPKTGQISRDIQGPLASHLLLPNTNCGKHITSSQLLLIKIITENSMEITSKNASTNYYNALNIESKCPPGEINKIVGLNRAGITNRMTIEIKYITEAEKTA